MLGGTYRAEILSLYGGVPVLLTSASLVELDRIKVKET